MNTQDYALVLGFNHYPRYTSQGRSLQGAVRDAERFVEWLLDTDRGGALPQENVHVRLAEDNRSMYGREAIDDALEEISDAAEANGARRFYFYFSGHGQSREHDDIALCLPRWSFTRRHAAISSLAYDQMVRRCFPFRELMMFLDCCRVRTVDATGSRSEIDCAVPVDGAGNHRRFVAYATTFESPAFEAQEDDDELGPIVRGHFTDALMAALWGGAASGIAGPTVWQIKEYLEKHVKTIAAESGHSQKAEVVTNFQTENPPVLGQATGETQVKITFSPERSGSIRLDGPTDEGLKTDDASSGPWEMTLRPGLHALTEMNTGLERTFRVRPDRGVVGVGF